MSSAMDKSLMAMRIEDDKEEVPFYLPDLPEYSSNENNVLSLIGRLLNPECQKMASLILDLPRKWQKVNRIRGVALSRERFQFFFDYEHDLEEILEKGGSHLQRIGSGHRKMDGTPSYGFSANHPAMGTNTKYPNQPLLDSGHYCFW